MSSYPAPPAGDRVRYENEKLQVPDSPVIPFVEGDGIGPDLWAASQRVWDAAVEKAYGGKKKIIWYEIFAGEKAHKTFGEWLPEKTVDVVREFGIAIKGPLTTPAAASSITISEVSSITSSMVLRSVLVRLAIRRIKPSLRASFHP